MPGSPAPRLAPTLAALRASAFDLLDALLPGEMVEIPPAAAQSGAAPALA